MPTMTLCGTWCAVLFLRQLLGPVRFPLPPPFRRFSHFPWLLGHCYPHPRQSHCALRLLLAMCGCGCGCECGICVSMPELPKVLVFAPHQLSSQFAAKFN